MYKIKEDEIKAIEREVREKDVPQTDNNFIIIPNDDTKTIKVCPSIENGVIELDKKRARVLVEIINQNIQKW